MANKKINLPERDYYPLDKAARRLECDVDDLLHFIATRRMRFLYRININEKLTLKYYEGVKPELISANKTLYQHYTNEYCNVIIDATSINKLLTPIDVFYYAHAGLNINYHYSSYGDYFSMNIFAEDEPEIKNAQIITPAKEIYVKADGLLNVKANSADIERLSFHDTTNTKYIQIIDNDDEDDFKAAILLQGWDISRNDIFISRSEIDLAINGGRTASIENMDELNINKPPPSKKTTNLQARVIKRLITAIAGEEEALNPRRALENGHSKLSRALTKAGVDIGATPTCIGKWLADVDD
ncbi:TPA: hypothetical protein KC770_002260 [Escherichia coli O146]|nr:hypothetical protein [Escherichia coli O146]